jgi:uncharacterized integral membrane protein
MFVFIFTLLFSAVVAYFALQNTTPITLHLASYELPNIPVYLAMLGSLVLGLLFAWMVHLLKAISSSSAMRGKNKELKEEKKENLELIKQMHQLELKNSKLTAKEDGTAPLEDNSL